MAWDSKSARRRQSSAASKNLPIHTRQPSRPVATHLEHKSTHTSDPFLQDFLDPSFDPATYLNASLSPLQHTNPVTGARGGATGQGVPLADLSSEAQTLLSQLNAHTTRLSGTLTQLTDDILRSGSRLAYEVELLRGETLSFAETMNESLQPEVKRFLPAGVGQPYTAEEEAVGEGEEGSGTPAPKGTEKSPQPAALESRAKADDEVVEGLDTGNNAAAIAAGDETIGAADEPQYIKQLRTLTLVRSRLDSVIRTFGDAMEFTFPPSELSVGSGFLSVSAPEPGAGSFGSYGGGGNNEQASTEDKGQEVLKKLREEVAELLRSGRDADGNEDPVVGIEKAAERVEQLKELTMVWKGTAEEKGRVKFIESLAKMVEERHKELMKEAEAAAKKRDSAGGLASEGGRSRKGSIKAGEGGTEAVKAAEEQKTILSGYGLMSQLQKLRSGL